MKASLTRGGISEARRMMNSPECRSWADSARALATAMKRANHRLTRRLWKKESRNLEDGWHTIQSSCHSWQIF